MVLEGFPTERTAALAWMARVRETTTAMTRRLSKTFGEKRLGRMSQEWLEEHSAEASKHDATR
jgi:hypothetical protein